MSSYRVRKSKLPKQRYITFLQFYPHYKIVALMVIACIRIDKSGKLSVYRDYAKALFNKQFGDVTVADTAKIEEFFKFCHLTIVEQKLNNETNAILLRYLDKLGVKYEVTDKKVKVNG